MSRREDFFDEVLASGEGALRKFFELLWQKTAGKRTHVLKGIRVPDTIVMSYSKPHHWYFTTKDLQIKRKLKLSLNSRVIEEHFLATCKSPSSVVAQQLSVNADSPETQHLSVTYIPTDDLRYFLHEDKGNGILQLFVDSKNENKYSRHNSVVNAVWTPNLFILEKVSNRNRIDDVRIDVQDRCVTFEQSRFTSTCAVVSSRISAMLEDACKSIAAHVEILHRYRITSMNLTFKIDADDTPWLMWCSSLRIIDPEGPARALTINALAPSRDTTAVDTMLLPRLGSGDEAEKPPRMMATNTTMDTIVSTAQKKKVAKVTRHTPCRLCHTEVPTASISNMPQQNITFALGVLEFYSKHPEEATYVEEALDSTTSEERIPAHVLLLHPDMELDEYLARRDDPVWNKQTVPLCHDCVQSLLQLTASIKVNGDGTIQNPFGKKKRAATSAKPRTTSKKPEIKARAQSSLAALPPLPSPTKALPLYDAGGLPEVWEVNSSATDAAELYTFERGVATKALGRKVVPNRVLSKRTFPMYKPSQPPKTDMTKVAARLNTLLPLPQEEMRRGARRPLAPVSVATTPINTPHEYKDVD
eukprot:PhM_4_TR9763/c0_g1_i1/m.46023